MDRAQYISEVKRLEEAKKALDEEYRNTMPIKPQQVVVIDGKEYWLERYRIIAYAIIPSLYRYEDGRIKRQLGMECPNNWRKMKPKNMD